MNTLLVIAFIANGVTFLWSLLIYGQYRRSRTPVPGYQVGATAGNVGMLFLLAGISTHLEEGVSTVLVILGGLLAVFSAVMTFRARRQVRTGRQWLR